LLISGVAGKLKSAQAAQCQDAPRAEEFAGCLNHIIALQWITVAVNQRQFGTTPGAGIGLGMKSAVQGIVVFLLTLGAHLELTHGGIGAIIGAVSYTHLTLPTICSV